jgi:biotin transporter BioY
MTAIAALYAGGMCAAQALGDPARGFAILALTALFVGGAIAKRRSMLAWKRKAANARTLLVTALAVIVVILIYGAGQVWQARGLAWAPVWAGLLIAVLVFLLGEGMRARFVSPRKGAARDEA